jgi:hypothetical protein
MLAFFGRKSPKQALALALDVPLLQFSFDLVDFEAGLLLPRSKAIC